MTDTTINPTEKDLAQRIADLEQRLAARETTGQSDTVRPDLTNQTTGFGAQAKQRVAAISTSSGIPVWALLVICGLALYGLFDILDDLHIF